MDGINFFVTNQKKFTLDDTEGRLAAQDDTFQYSYAKLSPDADGSSLHCRGMVPGHGVLQQIGYYVKLFGWSMVDGRWSMVEMAQDSWSSTCY